jgi:uncharacterized protein YecE (DUF72 family)
MDFGKVKNVEEVNFALPPDDPLTNELFELLGAEMGKGAVQLHVGGTQWRNKDWVGKLYPKGMKEADFLTHYGKQVNTIELNALFYNLQPKHVIERWASSVGEGFRFCPKFSNTISHIRQLRNVEQETDLFLDHMLSFGVHLGPSFLQLSEAFGPNRAQVLQDYARQLPRDFKVCIELRQEDWFGGAKGSAVVKDTWRSFRELGIGAVLTDTSGRRDCLHMKLTAPVAFIRFVANNLHPTDFLRIDAWADRIKTWIDKGLREIYFFVHSHNELYAPELFQYAVEQFNKRCGTDLKPPRLLNGGEASKLTLF